MPDITYTLEPLSEDEAKLLRALAKIIYGGDESQRPTLHDLLRQLDEIHMHPDVAQRLIAKLAELARRRLTIEETD